MTTWEMTTLAQWIGEEATRALRAVHEGHLDTLTACLEAIIVYARGLDASTLPEEG